MTELILSTLLSVTSPDGQNTLNVAQAEGHLYYTLLRGEHIILQPQPIALEIAGLRPPADPKVATFSAHLGGAMPHYSKRSHVALPANGARLTFNNGLGLEALATDQGVAYRWFTTLPGTCEVRAEAFGIQPQASAELFYGCEHEAWQGDSFQISWESPHHRSPMAHVPEEKLIYLPITLREQNTAIAIAEAELRDYPGMNLRRPTGANALKAWQARWPLAQDGSSRRFSLVTQRADRLVLTAGTRTFPWRVFLMAEDIGGLYANDLIMALSEPPAEDFAWVKPGQVAWDWWNHWGLEGTPFPAGVNTETYKAYIDFAAEYGLEYVILDEGWAKALDVTQIIPEMDLPAILAHAQARGIGIILWSTWQQLIGRQEEIFSHYAAMGVKGFKIDFFNRDDAEIARFLYHTAAVAAKLHLVLDYHGIHKPTGLSRTYPNVLSYEGVFGLEQVKWCGPEIDFITNDLRIAFTRLLAGPADYTPGAMRNAPRATYRANFQRPMSMGTRCRQAALFLVYDSPIRMLCDSPSAYAREPAFTRLLASCPTTFDDTWCATEPDPDQGLLVGRRKGDTIWYAGLAGNNTITFQFTPKNLDPAATYLLTIARDSNTSDAIATDYILENRPFRAGDALTLPCAPGGGFLARFTRHSQPAGAAASLATHSQR